MYSQTKEFFIHREFIDALVRSGHKRITEWFPVNEVKNNIYERIGMYIGYEVAETLLMKYRKSGVGPNEIKELLDLGEARF